jgi:hypothetical protein
LVSSCPEDETKTAIVTPKAKFQGRADQCRVELTWGRRSGLPATIRGRPLSAANARFPGADLEQASSCRDGPVPKQQQGAAFAHECAKLWKPRCALGHVKMRPDGGEADEVERAPAEAVAFGKAVVDR